MNLSASASSGSGRSGWPCRCRAWPRYVSSGAFTACGFAGVPHRTNRFFKGLVNIRGQLHLCVSLRGVLGIDGPDSDGMGPSRDGALNGETDHGMLVVAERRGERWVFIVDEMAAVERIPRKELRKVPGTLANPLSGYSQAVFIWRNRHVGFLDEERLLTAFGSLGQ